MEHPDLDGLLVRLPREREGEHRRQESRKQWSSQHGRPLRVRFVDRAWLRARSVPARRKRARASRSPPVRTGGREDVTIGTTGRGGVPGNGARPAREPSAAKIARALGAPWGVRAGGGCGRALITFARYPTTLLSRSARTR